MKKTSHRRRAVFGVETLEGKALLSHFGVSVHAATSLHAAAQVSHHPISSAHAKKTGDVSQDGAGAYKDKSSDLGSRRDVSNDGSASGKDRSLDSKGTAHDPSKDLKTGEDLGTPQAVGTGTDS